MRFGFTDGIADGSDAALSRARHAASGRRTCAGGQARARAADRRATVPAIAFVHSYGPVEDVVRRRDIAAAAGMPVWINRYGYLSDHKIDALARPSA